MPDTPKLRVYAVAAVFAPPGDPAGKLVIGTWFASDPAMAAAGVTVQVVQQSGETQPLQGVSCHELTEEWLVAALNAIRTGGKPGEVTPLRVVPEAQTALAQAEVDSSWRRLVQNAPPNGDGDAA